MDKITDEVIVFVLKFIVLPLFAVGVKLSLIKIRGGKVTKVNAVLSLFIGVVISVILKTPVESYIATDWVIPVIALVAILSDKIAETIINKVQIDTIIISLINNLITPKQK